MTGMVDIATILTKHAGRKAVIAADDPANSASLKMKQSLFSSTDFIDLDLVAGGGYIARITTSTIR